MATVREATLDLLRELRTMVFGDLGSIELPSLKEFPDDFRPERATALSMAEGYAEGTGNAARQRR